MASSNGNFPASMPVLKGKNYDDWCAQMKVIFRFQDVTEVVQEGVQEPDRNPTDAQKVAHRDLMKRDAKALFIIHQCEDADNFQKIRSADTTKKAWDTLEKSYAGDSKLKKVKLQTLRRQYELLQMSDQESIGEFFSRILAITNQMNAYGDKQSDLGIIDKVLRTLTPRFDHIVVAIEQGQNLEEMKIEELQGILEAQKMRLNERNSQRSVEQAMQAQTTKGNNYDGGKNKKGKGKGKNNKWKGSDECRNKRVPRNADEALLTQDEDSDSDKVLLMETTNSEEDNVNLWYLDTGCSNHMTGHREWFVSIDDKVKSKIKFANNSSVTAESIGKVMIQRKDGQHSFINDVLYVPNMKNNLLSLGQLLEKGYSMQMEDSQMKICDSKRRLILKASLLRNKTFKIGIQIVEFQCLAASISDESWMRHHRFGHLNFRSLTELKSKKMVHGLPQIEIPKQLCVECCVSKQPRNSSSQKFQSDPKESLK
ncbi:uncharacterized protein [Glycine max]|uniref:uncharacterized protein n=1 Tax=Glycine max TaxID=3847 RepID=UPI0003DEAFA9|nr:uncharacterized protein LOC102662365 [Glycine max]|eukprot:XP_006575979.1 uncharacterized protein LOC102662365 [Glycine max]